MPKSTKREKEMVVTYDPIQRARYEAGKRSTYDRWRWPTRLLAGRNNRANRCFPEVAVRAYFESLGFSVLLSAPKYPKNRGFILFHYGGLRRSGHAAKRMQDYFPNVDLHALAEHARRLKRKKCQSAGGGDPDLFVFRHGSSQRFFVEAKDLDQLRCSQRVCFPLIRRVLGCPVKIVRVKPHFGGDA